MSMLNHFFDYKPEVLALDEKALELCQPYFKQMEDIRDYNQLKMLKAFADTQMSSTDMLGTTGYGLWDTGRAKLEQIFAEVMGAEDALVRSQFQSGTHTLAVALFGLLRAGDTLLAALRSLRHAGVKRDAQRGLAFVFAFARDAHRDAVARDRFDLAVVVEARAVAERHALARPHAQRAGNVPAVLPVEYGAAGACRRVELYGGREKSRHKNPLSNKIDKKQPARSISGVSGERAIRGCVHS